jgi:plastocyanin
VAVLLLGAGISLAACSSGSTSSPSTTAAGSTATSGGSGSDAIAIQNFAFAPDSLTVAPGATVTVTNHDQVAHTVTAVKGAFNTGNILPSQSKTFTAPNTPGTYAYICSIHQYMTGTLVVSG